jgi:hypothetical protein
MGGFSVILDANVLVPMSLRDTLLIAAEVGLYRPQWSGRIVRVRAQAIVTMNTKHFPASVLQAWDIEARRPDEFLTALFDHDRDAMVHVIDLQAMQTRSPVLTVERVLANIELFAPTFVERVRAARHEHA